MALHGKFEPSAFRGLLSGLPYGGGVAIIMWPWVVEAKRARAEQERMDMIEDILLLGSAAELRSGRSFLNQDLTKMRCGSGGVPRTCDLRIESPFWRQCELRKERGRMTD